MNDWTREHSDALTSDLSKPPIIDEDDFEEQHRRELKAEVEHAKEQENEQ